jgi:hypothetical protein
MWDSKSFNGDNSYELTKRNSITEAPRKSKGDSSRAPVKRTELTTLTRSKKPGSIHGKGATKANKMRRDLEKTERRKSGKNGSRRALKRVVDWNEFHDLLFETFESCNHDHALCRRILTGMGLGDEAIDAALLYLEEQGGYPLRVARQADGGHSRADRGHSASGGDLGSAPRHSQFPKRYAAHIRFNHRQRRAPLPGRRRQLPSLRRKRPSSGCVQ